MAFASRPPRWASAVLGAELLGNALGDMFDGDGGFGGDRGDWGDGGGYDGGGDFGGGGDLF
jgi:hypothetical protein